MTISKSDQATQAYVWIWLSGKTAPIVAGRLLKHARVHQFTYGRSYLKNPEAIKLSPFELPLESGDFMPEGMHTLHSCLRDAAPDAWGRRLIDYHYGFLEADELAYLLLSGSNRIGALDFQESAVDYIPREVNNIALEELLQANVWIEKQQPLPIALAHVLLRGTSVGGARPKALIQDKGDSFIAKFGLSTDPYNLIKAEYVAMRLAQYVGLNVASVALRSVLGKDVLLVKRFDRCTLQGGQTRRLMLSGLSLLRLHEMEARYAAYPDLAEIIRHQFARPDIDLPELYKRLIFNVLIGNTDDHARNHSAFWDGHLLELTPAYDLCPQVRTGQEATQAMALRGSEGNFSTLVNVLSISEAFQISVTQAHTWIEEMISIVEQYWVTVCEEADLATIERERLWKKMVFNPFCFQKWHSNNLS